MDRFLDVDVGIYQICILLEGNVTFRSTGVSIRIQNYTAGLEVNGVRPNRGLRIAVPKHASSRLRFFRHGHGMVIGDQISMIRLEDDCFNPEHNPDVEEDRQQSAHIFTNSGHLTVASFPIIGNEGYLILTGSDAIQAMQMNIYKVGVSDVSIHRT